MQERIQKNPGGVSEEVKLEDKAIKEVNAAPNKQNEKAQE
jgi:hypothetical protein